jgi:hypothetical protein
LKDLNLLGLLARKPEYREDRGEMGRPGLGTPGAMDYQACAYPRSRAALREGPAGAGGREEVGEKLTGKVHFAFLHFLHKFKEKFPGQVYIRKRRRGRRFSIFSIFFIREHRLKAGSAKRSSPLTPLEKRGGIATIILTSPLENPVVQGDLTGRLIII